MTLPRPDDDSGDANRNALFRALAAALVTCFVTSWVPWVRLVIGGTVFAVVLVVVHLVLVPVLTAAAPMTGVG